MAFGVAKTTSHVLGQARSFTRNVGNTVIQNHDAISMGLLFGGGALAASGVATPLGLGMMEAGGAINTLSVASDVASGKMSSSAAMGEIAAKTALGATIGGIGGRLGAGMVGRVM